MPALATPQQARNELWKSYKSLVEVNPKLDRKLVSFQANKKIPFYSWLKYKEGFSATLVDYLIQHSGLDCGVILDPFAGAGAALFAAAECGWRSLGIELLPVGQFSIQARLAAMQVNPEELADAVTNVLDENFSSHQDTKHSFQHIRITRGAFPSETETQLSGYISLVRSRDYSADVRTLLEFACFAILESISYTRKDGQYLRWDYRSGRGNGKTKFDKGVIFDFRTAITEKLSQITADLEGTQSNGQHTFALFKDPIRSLSVDVIPGTCLHALPAIETDSIDLVVTSPPYCNRYDYTRTYALELAFLGNNEDDVKQLRQAMLSCTVENKSKVDQLREFYCHVDRAVDFKGIDEVFSQQMALQEVLSILYGYKDEGSLNNANIPNLVENYFYEMAFVVFELSRCLKPGAKLYMVNDNVRYAGEEIPVDLILSDYARAFGLCVDQIWALPTGKGNSSQQMGSHGRSELRKCVYIWSKRG